MSWNSYISDSNLLVSQFKAKLTTVFNKAKTINQTIAEDYNVNNYNINKFDDIILQNTNLTNSITTFNDTITNRGIDIVLLADQADQFVCNAIDAFDRLIDIRTFAIDDSLMSILNNNLNLLKVDYIDKFFSDADVVKFNDSTDVVKFNKALNDLFYKLEDFVNTYNSYIYLINLSNSNVELFSKILRVNTTVGTALSVSSKSWNLAKKLNKHNYKSTITSENYDITSQKQEISYFPLQMFNEFPKYIIRDNIDNYITENDILNINKSFQIRLNSLEYIDVIVSEININQLDDPGFGIQNMTLQSANDNISKFYNLFDNVMFDKIIKNAFVISNYDKIKTLLPNLGPSLLPDSDIVDSYASLGYDLKFGLIVNLKEFITSKVSHNIIYEALNYKFGSLKPYPTIAELGLEYESYIPSGLFSLPWLYTNGLNANTSDAIQIYDLIFNESSSVFNHDLNVDYMNFNHLCYNYILGYSYKNVNKIVSIYLKNDETHSTTVLKRFESNINTVSNPVDTASGLIYFVNPMNREHYMSFKYLNDFYFYLEDTYLNIDDPLYTDTRKFNFFGKYNIIDNIKTLESFKLKESKTVTDGYEGKVDRYETTIYSVVDYTKHYITGSCEHTHTETSYITDNQVVRVATNVANTYRELLLDNKIGYNDARFKAIQFTIKYLRFRETFDIIIDKSWDLNIPRYQ